MTSGTWGALAGAVLAGANMFILWFVAARVESRSKGDEARRTVGLLKAVALFDLLLFPIVGYFIGPMMM